MATDPGSVSKFILGLPGVVRGRSYGLPSFKLGGKFFARFRDNDEVLVVTLGSMEDRDVLMKLDPGAFFLTDHYRDYPTVLVRLARVRRALLEEVIRDAWRRATSGR